MSPRQFTPGPFRFQKNPAGNLRMYSVTTGETVAFILSREWGDYESMPDGPTALGNAQLFRFAGEMLEALEAVLAALNTVPRFRVAGQGDSYAVAARLEALIKSVRGES
jgi:hypothetical protein